MAGTERTQTESTTGALVEVIGEVPRRPTGIPVAGVLSVSMRIRRPPFLALVTNRDRVEAAAVLALRYLVARHMHATAKGVSAP